MTGNNPSVPHRRFDPLRGRWILVSPYRTERPWLGDTGRVAAPPAVHYDPACYLCPGNARAGGMKNPSYSGVYVFDNDYAALLPDPGPDEGSGAEPLLLAESERGVCRVLCFHPDHSLTLARMEQNAIAAVVDEWTNQWNELAASPGIAYAQIFENHGALMGASNPHPHCQIWATGHLPDEPDAELASQRSYYRNHRRCLLCDYLKVELNTRERIVCENDEFVAVVPFWAVWPFETILLSRRHVNGLDQFNAGMQGALAEILKRLTTRYDNLFATDFPYTMGFHQRPTDGGEYPEWHWHGHFYPPLLRSATVRKFMVGFEMLGMSQRDITPESAAAQLKAASETHYTKTADHN